MAKHFKTLREAKQEWQRRNPRLKYNARHEAYTPVQIYNRNKGRKQRGLKPLQRPYFVGTYMEWLNL